MRTIAYGYKRATSEFDHIEYTSLHIDRDTGDRSKRKRAIASAFPGDKLVVLAMGDIGFGQEVAMVKKFCAKHGVEIEVVGTAEQARGRPKLIELPADKRLEIEALWLGSMHSTAYVAEKAAAMGGLEINKQNTERVRQWLYKQFGARVNQ